MSDPRLALRLDAVSHRRRRLLRLQFLTIVCLVAAAYCLLLRASSVSVSLWWTLGGLALAVAGAFWIHRRRAVDQHRAAGLIEQRFADLDSRLLTALAQTPDPTSGEYSYLQSRVVSEVIDHAQRHPWTEAVPTGRLRSWQAAQLASSAAFLVAAVWASRGGNGDGAAVPDPSSDAGGQAAVVVEPGDVELERGRSLIVTARFGDPPPADAELVTTDSTGAVQRRRLSRSLDDPVFGGHLPDVQSDLTYYIESADQRSEAYRVTTFEFPALLRADAIIATPAYSQRGPERIEDVRRVSLYEGSTLTLECRFNKPLASATLQPEQGTALAFGPFTPANDTEDDPDDVMASVTWQPTVSQTLELAATDSDGRGLRDPVAFHVEVLPNRPPELTVTFPSRDVQVSPLEEVSLEATAWDDFGLLEYGVVVRMPSGDERTIVLGSGSDTPAADAPEVSLAHLLELEELAPAARDLLSYSFYADDLNSDGQVRRTFGDVFFAEVRHFDEEYRQRRGQPSGGGAGGAGSQNPAQQLVDVQRQIVISAWNAFRAWPAERVTDDTSKYRDETQVLADSQQAAKSQLAELAAELTDAAAQQHAALADQHMSAAHEHFALAQTEAAVAPLTPARHESQSAYQELLRLRDRLHVVQQGQQGGGGGGGGGLDQQLSQLELRNDRNRYEQEQQAQDARSARSQEQLNVLNRLRELARRQDDLNERIKDLEDRRRAAKSDSEREEIERELKRLRDEQQELLRDADELRERMQQPQNQRQMAEARQQLDQTRSDLQRASEALEAGQASRALTAGTRAHRRLEEMKEEFRRRTAGAFDEAVRELQQDARELADRQRAIGKDLQQSDEPAADPRPSLRDTDRREELGAALAGQQQRLSSLLDRMREVVQQSELSEPLLSQKLYDAVLESRRDQPDEGLRVAQELLRRGFLEEGTHFEQQARAGIERLEQGINRAAESILGDELKSLQRARQQVADLARELEDELAHADPRAGQGHPPSSASPDPSTPIDVNPTSEPPENPESHLPGRTPDARTPSIEPSASRPSGGQPPEGQPPGSQQSAGDQPGEQSNPQSSAEHAEQPGGGGQQPGGTESPTGDSGQDIGGPPGARDGGATDGRPLPGEATPSAADTLANLFRTGGPEEPAGTSGGGQPLTGQDFTGWSDRLRDVEEMLSLPELRAQAGAIRERARDVRRDFKRHSQTPDWDLVRTEIYGPLLELQTRLAEEIARRQPHNDLVPIDRDPVPEKYSELVREYYEQLSRARRQ